MAAWIPSASKPGILKDEVWNAIEHDGHLRSFYQDEFATIASERFDADPVSAHLRFQRRINLAGLLGRLDSSTMLASVEGRTPFADVEIARLAESLPLVEKFAAKGELPTPLRVLDEGARNVDHSLRAAPGTLHRADAAGRRDGARPTVACRVASHKSRPVVAAVVGLIRVDQ
jgi:hypothetical protein